ncbi:ABC transporter permease [Neomicrococcus lactis]|uniref:ABC transporter permease n=1 Tax=Neomicrococcus lactis TaxID=732241 RepID=UPI003A5C7F95
MTDPQAPATQRIDRSGTDAAVRLFNSSLKAHAPAESAKRARKFGTLYIAEGHLLAMRRYIDIIIAYSVGNPLMYLFAMGVGLASLVDANSANAFGVSYVTFIAPALLVSAAVMTAAGEFTYVIMSGFKWNRTFYGPLSTAITPYQISQGLQLAVTTRIFAQSIVYLLIVVLFGATGSAWAWVSVLIATLAGTAFGFPLMAYAASLEEERGQFQLVNRFIVMPLFLFSGTFFPLTTLPWFLQWIGWISPIWHGTELSRVFSYGYQEPLWLSILHVLYLVALTFIGWHFSRRIFARRLEG